MRLAIIGGRDFSDYELLKQTLNDHFFCETMGSYGWMMDEIVSGGAKGGDQLGAQFAREENLKLTEFLPDWDKHGKRAGFIRNEDIIKNSDFVCAFWSGLSKGTGNSLSIAKRLKKPTLIIYF